MTVLQGAFVLALLVVLAGILGFAVVMARAALATDGGRGPSAAMLTRLLRSPQERAELNRWAFYAHRLSGVAILAFLCIHVLDVGLYALSPEWFDEVHDVYGTVPMRLFECALLAAILFHTFNGIRLIAIDVLDLGVRRAQQALVGVLAVVAGLGLLGAIVILAPVF